MSDQLTRRVFIVTTAGIAAGAAARNTSAATVLSRNERRTLKAVIDRIVPADGRMPAASAVDGVPYIEAVLARDAEIRKLVSAALRGVGAGFAEDVAPGQVAALEKLERADRAAFGAIRDLSYGRTYRVQRLCRLPGYAFRRGGKRTAVLETFDDEQLERVRRMPRLYRETK